MLAKMPKAVGTDYGGKQYSDGNVMLPSDAPPTLSDLGIEKMQSSRWQTIADLGIVRRPGQIICIIKTWKRRTPHLIKLRTRSSVGLLRALPGCTTMVMSTPLLIITTILTKLWVLFSWLYQKRTCQQAGTKKLNNLLLICYQIIK